MLTMEHFKKRGFQLTNRSPLCGKAEEELNHLLIHCPLIWGLWEDLISIPSLAWVCPFSHKDLFLGWTFFSIRKRARKLWRSAPLCLLWAIWKEKNQIVFNDVPFSLTRLKSSFVSMLVSWAGYIEVEEGSFVRIFFVYSLGFSCGW